MVIRGKTRGNGRQLSNYLLHSPDNDNVQLVEIRGTSQPDNVKYSLIEMSLTAELTKSSKGLYHVQINPAPGEDRVMTMEDWIKAADILEKEAGFEGQKRLLLLHHKRSRIHAHCVWERFNHDTGTMISDSFNRLAQDRARMEMERVFEHKRTPDRNVNKDRIKERLTELWNTTKTADDFMRLAIDSGLHICKGTQRPFMVVDDTGRSFDLVRQLNGIKTKEVRERLQTARLQTDKEVIQSIRVLQNTAAFEIKQNQLADKLAAHKTTKAHGKGFDHIMKDMKEESLSITNDDNHKKKKTANLFAETKMTIEKENIQSQRQKKIDEFKQQFLNKNNDQQRDQEHEP